MIGFVAFKDSDTGDQRYGVRGTGIDMDEFNDWLRQTSASLTSMDWPWMYFKFVDPVDEAEFWAKYNVPGNYFDVEYN